MVRLKVADLKNLNQTIKFQFQNGTIKRCCSIKGKVQFCYFNSKMVRLKDPTGNTKELIWLFQFQNGTIKRLLDRQLNRLLLDFNSKMVRLKDLKISTYEWIYEISIPKWYD